MIEAYRTGIISSTANMPRTPLSARNGDPQETETLVAIQWCLGSSRHHNLVPFNLPVSE